MHQQSARPAPSTATFPHRAKAAGILQVFPKNVARWDQQGLLPHHRTLGSQRRSPATAIEQLAASLTREVRAA
jgi:hypothetical protein